MKEKKINLKQLKSQIILFKRYEFVYPKEYRLNFALFRSCKCCGKKSLSNRVSVFDNELVCICKNCGARRNCKFNTLWIRKLLRNFLLVAIFLLIFSVCMCASAQGNIGKKELRAVNGKCIKGTQTQVMADLYDDLICMTG